MALRPDVAIAQSFEVEPNDSPTQATALNSHEKTSGTNATTTDQDWYKIQSTQSGAMTVTVNQTDRSATLENIEIRNAAGTILSTFSANSPGGATGIVSHSIGVTPGKYYIHIPPTYYAGASYEVTADLPHIFQTEPNNTRVLARPLTPYDTIDETIEGNKTEVALV